MRRALLLSLFLSASAYASTCCPRFHVGADFLYWSSRLNEVQYATSYTLSATGTPFIFNGETDAHFLDGGWNTGFRLFAAYDRLFCDLTLSASYTRVTGADSDLAEAGTGQLFTTLGTPTSDDKSLLYMEAKNSYTYQSYDLLLSCPLRFWSCHTCTPFLGIEGMHLHQTLETESGAAADGFNGEADWETAFWGIGLKGGLSYVYQLCTPLSLFAKGSLSLIGGCATTDISQEGTTMTLPFHHSFSTSEGQFIPGTHLQLGVTYNASLCRCPLDLTIGWDFLTWWQRNPTFDSLSPTTFSNFLIPTHRTQNLTFQGLTIGLAVIF